MRSKLMVLAVLLVTLTGCAERYETTTVEAVVVDKEYDKAEKKTKTYKDSEGKTKTKTEIIPEEWEVTVEYDGIEKEFEFRNDDFYDSVEVGKTVPVELRTGLDKEGKVVSRSLQLP
ncbi:hypothetical protein [Paenibacillus soyae]|uniref:DUF3221 domain-containing protein n=1 Tax=Paenibacillus soyae TaxID=2969249 RepID=A0A9X2S7S3_9BACL|nr:hypothetical protein [Paenibacillus soyae]MCR2803644.1 hypothetical protein [Paenibacillus soyae]